MLDSNIWIYYFDAALPEHPSVVKAVDQAVRTGVILSTIVLIEVAHYFFTQSPKAAGAAMRRLRTLSTARIFDFALSTYDRAAELLHRYAALGIGGRDAAILATMQEAGIDELLSHDTAFRRIPFIHVIDPVLGGG